MEWERTVADVEMLGKEGTDADVDSSNQIDSSSVRKILVAVEWGCLQTSVPRSGRPRPEK